MRDLTYYRFCDVAVELSARRPEALVDFASVYGAFREEGVAQDAACKSPPPLVCSIDTDETGRGHVAIEGVSYPVSDPDTGSAYLLALIFDHVAAQSASHLFVHASAVERNGRALLLVGPSGHGKSTLAQALAAQGATVLCDDVAPLEIASGTVSSFPLRHSAPPRMSTAPVTDAFLLHSPALSGPSGCAREAGRPAIHLALDRWPVEWDRDPPWGAGAPVVVRQAHGHWEVIAQELAPGVARSLIAACRAAGVIVLRDLSPAAPDFGPAPAVASITRAAALPQLMSHLFGRDDRALTEVGWRLASALGRARFWQLCPGPPGPTAEAVLRTSDGTGA